MIDADGKVRRYQRQGTPRARYAPGWLHPLSPYTNVGKEKHLPVKAAAAPTCRDWIGIVYRDPEDRMTPAASLSNVIASRAYAVDMRSVRLFAGGFVNDQSLVEGYVEGEQPLVIGRTRSAAQRIEQTAARLVLSARVVEQALRWSVKSGLGLSPKRGAYDAVDLSSVGSTFWSRIEPDLRGLLAETGSRDDVDVPEQSTRWVAAMSRAAHAVFEESVPLDPLDPNVGAAVTALHNLGGTLRGYGKLGNELFGRLLLPVAELKKEAVSV
jgi:hypothetical protein